MITSELPLVLHLTDQDDAELQSSSL
jgi:hypothetical protein